MRKKYQLLSFGIIIPLVGCGFYIDTATLTKIEITTDPSKISYYVGQAFDTTGLVLSAFYDNGSVNVVNDYNYWPKTPLTLEDTTITFAYKDKRTTYSIEVLDDPSSSDINVPNELELEVGEEYRLFPTLSNNSLGNNNFCFVSYDEEIIEVNKKGVLTPYKTCDEITIKTYSDNNYNGAFDSDEPYGLTKVKIKSPSKIKEPTHLYSSFLSKDAFPNSIYHLKAEILPTDTTYRKLRFVSSDETIATVDQNGEIHNLKEGNAIITVYNDKNNNNELDDDELRKETFFAIRKPEKEYSVKLNAYKATIKVGETYQINPSVTPYEPGYFGYASYNEDVAVVSNGLVKGIYPGKTTIEVRFSGGYGYLDVEVVPATNGSDVKAAKITINEEDIVLKENQTHVLKTILSPISNETIIYSSNNTNVASISSNGEILAKNRGSALITAKINDTILDNVKVIVNNDTDFGTSFYDGYYGDLSWNNSEDLINKLHERIRNGYNGLTYNGSTTNWETNQYADEDINDSSMVNAVYSSSPISKTDTFSGWQREHAFAATLLTGNGTGVAVNSKGRATDFHNLYAAGKSGNSSRGNKNFGFANKALGSYSDKTDYSFDYYNFEPADEDKGKLARAILYMTVMYNLKETETVKDTWTFTTEEDISSHSKQSKTISFIMDYNPVNLLNGYADYDRVSLNDFMAKKTPATELLVNKYTEILKSSGSTLVEGSDDFRIKVFELFANDYSFSAIGNKEDLLKWNAFKVDTQEMQHTDSVYSHVGIAVNKGIKQGNRNPFVDYPELVDYIFGVLKDQGGSLSKLKPSVLNK